MAIMMTVITMQILRATMRQATIASIGMEQEATGTTITMVTMVAAEEINLIE